MEAALQKIVAEMNAKTGGNLPIPELTAEWAWEQFLASPPGMIVDLFIFMHAKMPSKADLWNIESLIDTMYSTTYNPMAWFADYIATKNGAGYARIPQEAPQDIFYSIIPWSYQLLWTQAIWTFEPIWFHLTNMIQGKLDGMNEMNPYAIQGKMLKTLFDFDATCPDVQARIAPKM